MMYGSSRDLLSCLRHSATCRKGRVEVLQLDARGGRGEGPGDRPPRGVARGLPGHDLGAHAVLAGQAPAEASTIEHSQLYLGHVEPTAMFGGIVELELARDAARFDGGEGLVEGRQAMRVEIVEDHTDGGGLRKVAIDQVPHTVGKVLGCAPVGDVYMPPADLRLHEHEEVAGPLARVLIVVLRHRARPGREGLAHLAHQLIGALVKADIRTAGIIGFLIHIQDIFHAGHKLGADTGDAPLLLQPRLDLLFAKRRRTVSSESEGTISKLTTWSASSCSVQSAWPGGGSLQANATRYASCLPSSLRRAPGRGRS